MTFLESAHVVFSKCISVRHYTREKYSSTPMKTNEIKYLKSKLKFLSKFEFFNICQRKIITSQLN